jgi:hypothetical protein
MVALFLQDRRIYVFILAFRVDMHFAFISVLGELLTHVIRCLSDFFCFYTIFHFTEFCMMCYFKFLNFVFLSKILKWTLIFRIFYFKIF